VSDDDRVRDDFLSRWSRRKNAARTGTPQEPEARERPAAAVPTPGPSAQGESRPPEPLPPVESLTPESDFTPFMRSEVDPAVRRQALRTLFRDPRFNEMDGLDVYISDFSQPDPIPPEWLGQLNQLARLGEYHAPEDEKKEKEAAGDVEGSPQDQIAEAEQGVSEAPVVDGPDVAQAGSPPSELQRS
jgi:hypothetical protein